MVYYEQRCHEKISNYYCDSPTLMSYVMCRSCFSDRRTYTYVIRVHTRVRFFITRLPQTIINYCSRVCINAAYSPMPCGRFVFSNYNFVRPSAIVCLQKNTRTDQTQYYTGDYWRVLSPRSCRTRHRLSVRQGWVYV